MSKGSKQRPTDKKAFDSGYELAFGKKQPTDEGYDNQFGRILAKAIDSDSEPSETITIVHTLQ